MKICENSEAPMDVVWPIVQMYLEVLEATLAGGHDVRLPRIGTFRWYVLTPRYIRYNPAVDGPLQLGWRRKLRFEPSQFNTAQPIEEEDVEKYGVKFSRFKEKIAEESAKRPGHCPLCGEKRDEGGACPKHGTEPFEDTEVEESDE